MVSMIVAVAHGLQHVVDVDLEPPLRMTSRPVRAHSLLGLSPSSLPSYAVVPVERLRHPHHETYLPTLISLQSCPLHQYRQFPCCHAIIKCQLSDGSCIGSCQYTLRVLDPSLQLEAVSQKVNTADSSNTTTHQSLYSHIYIFSNIYVIISGALKIYWEKILHPA